MRIQQMKQCTYIVISSATSFAESKRNFLGRGEEWQFQSFVMQISQIMEDNMKLNTQPITEKSPYWATVNDLGSCY